MKTKEEALRDLEKDIDDICREARGRHREPPYYRLGGQPIPQRKHSMTDEEAEAFKEKMREAVSTMTGTINDPPRYQLTGEIIPPEVLAEETKE